jgi:putative membrane protein
MISAYSDHAANERTFLAWVRTGIAVIAFGFVIEKFNLFMTTLASSTLSEVPHRLRFEGLTGVLGCYDGLAFIAAGIALVVIATIRFVRTAALIDDPKEHSARSVRIELFMSAGLLILVASYSVFLVFS